MLDHLLIPSPDDEVRDSGAKNMLVAWLEKRENIKRVQDELIEVVGPLDVAGRWGLLGSYGLSDIRKQIDLAGPAFMVAVRISDICKALGYPPNALLVQLVGDKVNLDQLEPSLKPLLQRLLVPQEK